jgi:hypothetical protein
MSAATIARLKITLDDVKPVVLRRVEVPTQIGPATSSMPAKLGSTTSSKTSAQRP